MIPNASKFVSEAPAWCLVALLAFISFFYFPGHTFLQSDSQIYLPILERKQNPVLFEKDIMATRPFGYSIYDQTAAALANYSPLSLESALQLEQFVFRCAGVAGIYLIGLAIGLQPMAALFLAAVISLGAPVSGAALRTMEIEPIPRAFALGCILLATGLALRGQPAWAGAVGALAILYHPTTSIPFWIVAGFAVLRKSTRPVILIPLLPAVALLVLAAHMGPPSAEMPDVFHRLDAAEETLQRSITPYIFVSEWTTRSLVELICQCLVTALALWRFRARITGTARDFLVGMAAIGAASVPLSYIVLELGRLPQFQLSRAVVLLTLMSSLLAAACSLMAAENGRWIEAGAWLAVPILASAQAKLVTFTVTPFLIAGAAALLAAMVACQWLAKRTRGMTMAVAGVLPFFVFPAFGLVERPHRDEMPELDQVAAWAREKTPEDALFLFPDSGRTGDPAVFRARALRSLYVDWKSRGQANYFPGFELEWQRRWRDTREGRWIISSDADFAALRDYHVNYVVVRIRSALPGRYPEFSNSQFSVYQVW
jgi:hypothetical protein